MCEKEMFELLKASSFNGVKDFFQSLQSYNKHFFKILKALKEIFDTFET
jgi:hypothetical protein